MSAALAVALLGGRDLAGPLAERTGVTVSATTAADHLDVCLRLATDVDLVVGVATVPWPVEPELHARGSAELPAYTGVVSWHALPALHEQLAQAVAPGAGSGAHVLVTAPDPGPDMEPGDAAFLREVAAAVGELVAPASASIAWRGTTRTPTAVDALRSLVEAHGRRDVVECPVAPGTGGDAALLATAEELGVRLTTADLGRATQLDLLTEVVATVADHELDGGLGETSGRHTPSRSDGPGDTDRTDGP